jgi:23S rRNA (guanosine2251-2'-O)-methyltransferase
VSKTTKQQPSVNDSKEYQQKKQFFSQVVTLYGRKPVLEILNDTSLDIYRLHLADSNKKQGIINEIVDIAQQRNIDVLYHDRQALSRLSKNSKQDQGVCIDILCPQHKPYHEFLANRPQKKTLRLIALDRITNPQNLGMIIRSVCAGDIDGLLIPEKGCASIDSLVVKASAGTLFKAPLLHCKTLIESLKTFQQQGAKVYGLSSHSAEPIHHKNDDDFIIYVLGNETEGMSKDIAQLCDRRIFIPMNNQVESLNVAVTASLLAFKDVLSQSG